MANPDNPPQLKPSLRTLPRNVWAVSFTSFFMDISSEMVLNLLPLFMTNVLNVGTAVIGVIEGFAEATASLLKLFSGWLSDKLQGRKWLAVMGYGLSALSKPFFIVDNIWVIAAARWIDRVGKGIRTSPRDALVADSIDEKQRGMAFGFHRAADTAGAMLGILIALIVIWVMHLDFGTSISAVSDKTFHTIVYISLVPAVLAVISLTIGAKDTRVKSQRALPKFALKSLGKEFLVFIGIVSIFTLGNSSDAFIVLRAQDTGLNLIGITVMLVVFNAVYSLISTPAGILSDRIGRKRLIIGGWLVYGAIYTGFALASQPWHVFTLYVLYGVYYGMAYGTSLALIADMVPENMRGTAYGSYNGIVGILSFPASVIAGVLWQGIGSWKGFGAPAPFFFGGGMAFLAAVLLLLWNRKKKLRE
jgi:MFS family permease